jgi:hypothetical protein
MSSPICKMAKASALVLSYCLVASLQQGLKLQCAPYRI